MCQTHTCSAEKKNKPINNPNMKSVDQSEHVNHVYMSDLISATFFDLLEDNEYEGRQCGVVAQDEDSFLLCFPFFFYSTSYVPL